MLTQCLVLRGRLCVQDDGAVLGNGQANALEPQVNHPVQELLVRQKLFALLVHKQVLAEGTREKPVGRNVRVVITAAQHRKPDVVRPAPLVLVGNGT